MFQFPSGYGDNRIVLLVRDPWWLFAYWDISRQATEDAAKKIASGNESVARYILRVYDVTDINFDGKNAWSYFDIELKSLANSWYINAGSPDRSWIVEIGIITNKGSFYLLARSNHVRTPRHGMSEKTDVEWMMTGQ